MIIAPKVRDFLCLTAHPEGCRKNVEKQMRAAAADLNFEMAAELRDKMIELKKNLEELDA